MDRRRSGRQRCAPEAVWGPEAVGATVPNRVADLGGYPVPGCAAWGVLEAI
jgi:hypothetical protein